MAVNAQTALLMVKTRLNRLAADTSLDQYLAARVEAAEQQLQAIGINLADTTEDLLLVVDLAVWQYQNRDQATQMPPWLRLRRRERWLREGGTT